VTRVGVTGATGFIGGALLPHLARLGYDLIPVDDGSGPVRVEFAEWPVRARDFASDAGIRILADCDVVLHLGAVSGVMACAEDPVGTARVNVEGTRRLLTACGERHVAVAFASSLAVVGAPEHLPVTEETPARPTHEYARQKSQGEELTRELGRSARSPTATLRMSNVYGGYFASGRRVAKGNVLELFSQQAARGRLTVNAPGTQRRDFVHIEDVIAHWEATVRFLRGRSPSDGSVTFNVATGESYSVLEIAQKVADRWGALHPSGAPVRVEVVPNPRAGVELIEPEFAVSRSATERALGLQCRHTVDGTIDVLLAPPAHATA